jgi:hypothetical protein
VARVHRSVAGLVAVGVLLALTGCVGFRESPPPRGSDRALERIIARIDRVDGVASVTGDVHQRDVKDHPDDWLAVLTIRASTSDLAVADRVRSIARAGVPGARVVASLAFPHPAGEPVVVVDPMRAELVTFAGRVLTMPFVHTADIHDAAIRLTLRGDPALSDVVPRIRPVPAAVPTTVAPSGGDGLGEEVEITARQPGTAALATIDALRSDPRTLRVSASAGTTYAAADASQGPEGIQVRVATSDVRGAVSRLAATADETADAHIAPRGSYAVRSARGADEVTGPLGLPAGTPQPDDSVPPWSPTDVGAAEAALRAFLDRSVAATGVPASVTTGREQCTPSGATLPTGTRATAETLVPVFDRYDDAQEPFDSVTASWSTDGLRMTDRAMGLDHWSAPSAAAPLASATIRGSAEGIRLAAESVCVG